MIGLIKICPSAAASRNCPLDQSSHFASAVTMSSRTLESSMRGISIFAREFHDFSCGRFPSCNTGRLLEPIFHWVMTLAASAQNYLSGLGYEFNICSRLEAKFTADRQRDGDLPFAGNLHV